jgi:hypothetical protein
MEGRRIAPVVECARRRYESGRARAEDAGACCFQAALPSLDHGITGAATIAFAREEAVLDQVPEEDPESLYHELVLPGKRRLDARYMASATFLSDLKLIVKSALRRWDSSLLEDLLNTGTLAAQNSSLPSRASDRQATFLSSQTRV